MQIRIECLQGKGEQVAVSHAYEDSEKWYTEMTATLLIITFVSAYGKGWFKQLSEFILSLAET